MLVTLDIFYKGIIRKYDTFLQRNNRKMTILWSFSYHFFVKKKQEKTFYLISRLSILFYFLVFRIQRNKGVLHWEETNLDIILGIPLSSEMNRQEK